MSRHLQFLWNGGLDPATALPGELRARRTLSASIAFLSPIGLIVIVVNALTGMQSDNLTIAGGLVVVISALYVQAFLDAPTVAANMAVAGFWGIIVFIMVASGLLGQTWFWLYSVPPVAALLGGLRSGAIWSAISALTMWTFALLHLEGGLPFDAPIHASREAQIIGIATEGSLVLLMLCVAVLVFRYAEQTAEGKLEETVLTLEGEVRNRAIAEEEARLSEQSKSAFLAAMSHELRTPLNGVIGALRLLRDAENESEKAEYAEVAEQSGETGRSALSPSWDMARGSSWSYRSKPCRSCRRKAPTP